MCAAITEKNYEEWKQNALLGDARSGADTWKDEELSDLYDYRVIRLRYEELVQIRASGDIQNLLYYLNEGIHGNMGGMGAPQLYTHAKFGTKTLIVDYVNELVAAIDQLAGASEQEISHQEKLAVFRRSSVCFGRTAMMLSGAGPLGPFHIGVVKALWEQNLLPDIISGASAGAVVTAIVGTHQNRHVSDLFRGESLNELVALLSEYAAALQTQEPVSNKHLKSLIESLIPDMTFVEALEESGRYINIPVAPIKMQQRSRLLNAITAPNALIRDAVLASCSIPGIFPSVTLAAKDRNGKRRPYVPSRKWVDGSITSDLPAKRLARLYSVNHFISSQANPMVIWALQDTMKMNDPWSRFMTIYQSAARDWMRAIYPLTMEMIPNSHPAHANTRMLFDLMTQEYTADITILPERRIYYPGQLLLPLSPEETMALIEEGERATWPKIERIRNNTLISRKLDAVLGKFDQSFKLHARSAA